MLNSLHLLNSESNFYVYNKNLPPLSDSDIPISKINSGYTNQFCKAKLISGIKPTIEALDLYSGIAGFKS
jgi:hypothetical protein